MKSITDANTEIENDLKLRAIIPVFKNCSKKFRKIRNSHKLLKTPRSIRVFFGNLILFSLSFILTNFILFSEIITNDQKNKLFDFAEDGKRMIA